MTRRVEVEWDDAASSRYVPGLVVRRSAGYLVKHGRKVTVIAGTKDGKRRFEDFLTVPTPNIRRIRKLK